MMLKVLKMNDYFQQDTPNHIPDLPKH